ncbi:MAG: DNA/RNA nuclease SfsA [Alphaproteobacteria bacterium]|nr:DNA/RNA nuclease SfsA [Alphaproteobacteria bacterium]
MRFPDPLLPGRLVRRYKRFFADVELTDDPKTGEVVTAHCPNPGSMLGLKDPGLPAWVSPARNPERKLRYTLELVEADGAMVGINTGWPNALAAEAIAAGVIPELAGYPEIKREVKYGKSSRIDLLLSEEGRPPCYVEVKNVHLSREAGLAEFPDSVTARGAKHLDELGDMVESGARAVMLYVVQRGDCEVFRIAGDIDPAYQSALARARLRGVEALCYACHVSSTEIELAEALRLDLIAPGGEITATAG